MERTNIRYVTPEDLQEPPSFISIDVAFISLTKVLEPVKNVMTEDGQVVCLIKPQFEAGREKVGKKGVVRDKSVHLEVIEMVILYAQSLGFEIKNLEFSPIKGPEGNIEYLLYMEKTKERCMDTEASEEPEEDGEEIDAAFSVMPLSPEADELVRQADRITKEAHEILDK
jgi:23S rRNA (cytidine1920-2'-O)/16S rRNA (cytidine1409-2'-O)-methyltransferase